jgi:EF hand domain-containing protein
MKLAAALALVTTLGLGGIAHADPAGPAPRSPYANPAGPPGQPRGELRQALLERFDRNHDGVLDAKERHRAIRALRRIARRMALQEHREHGEVRGRAEVREPADVRDRGDVRERGERPDPSGQRARQQQRIQRLIQRFDRNGDGVVSPDEMPPGVARRLQQLDRNGDGWLDQRDER